MIQLVMWYPGMEHDRVINVYNGYFIEAGKCISFNRTYFINSYGSGTWILLSCKISIKWQQDIISRPKWSIVYDVTNMRIYFRIFETPVIVGEKKIFLKQPGEAILKFVDFKNFDFYCHNTPGVLDLNDNHEGSANQYFVNYSTAINKEFIEKAFTFFKGWGVNITIKEEDLNNLATYPESFKCMVK